MPILEIEIVTRPGESLPRGLTAKIADEAAEILHSRPGGTWVRLRTLSSDSYAENGGGPPSGIHPIFVSVLKSRLPSKAELAREAQQLAQAIARISDRPPDNVHILYLPEGVGRIAFGGRLLDE
jgi:phenylpyruvate tautomerase PptA (4-oxalocrotonate tautomerase family)